MRNPTPTLAGALALPAVLEHILEKRLLALRSLLLIPIVLLAWMSPVRGDTFENFVIQNSSNPIPGGALFGGGTYSGSFSLDESLIPANPDARFALQTFNVSFSVPFPNFHADISSANGGSAIFSTFTLPNIQQSAVDLAIDTIQFFGPDLSELSLELVEPVNVFQGGLVAFASAENSIFEVQAFDDAGSALVIDPVVVPVSSGAPVPEPATWVMMVLGMGLLCIGRIRRPNTVTAA
jgi:hypothetical protein